MSTWNLGIDDVSEETRAYKDKISSKDGQIAAQQDRLVKQAADYEEMKERLNDALHKLTTETQRALRLEADLNQRSEDLRDEKIASENAKAALISAQEKNKSSNLELRQLEGTLERISHTSDEHKARAEKLERDKSMLDTRVRELESNLRDVTQINTTTTPGRRVVSRPRSSSLSNFRITTLEQDLLEARSSLAKKETDLQAAGQKLAQVQKDLIKADNDKAAIERKWSSQVETLRASLEEKEEELAYLREQQGDRSREDELLKRIEEDGAKIAALELMLRGEEGSRELKERLRHMESQLKNEHRQQAEIQERCTELIREKEEALDELEETRQELREIKAREYMLKQRAAKSLETWDDPLMNDDSCLIDMDTLEPASMPITTSQPVLSTQQETDIDAITQIERLLSAIERLRGERDSLRRDVQFLETESRFAIEALEAKLSASVSTNSNTQTMATIDELRSEMDDLHAQLLASNEKNAASIHEKNMEIKKLGVQVQALAVALEHASSQVETPGSPSRDRRGSNQHDNQTDNEGLQNQYDGTVRSLGDITKQRDSLLSQLQTKDTNWEAELEATREAEQVAREHLEEAMHEISELNNHIDAIESERDSLTLQVTNLTTDLQIAQDELTNAESRYTNLQFHQLNTMTSNEATRTLRDHIEELEGRVLRRNELVGILQHDVRRLDTNLRLQEERLIEMTSELEMLAAQKDAMVEDCADAREARDEALVHVEALEDDLENMEGQKAVLERQNAALEGEKAALEGEKAVLETEKVTLEGQNTEHQVIIDSLIAVVQDSVNYSREAICRAKDQAINTMNGLSSAQQEQSGSVRQLRANISSLIDISKQSEERRNELQKVDVALDQCQAEVQELSTLTQNLQQEKAAVEAMVNGLQEQHHESIIEELQAKNKELQDRVHQVGQVGSSNDDAEQNLVQLKLQHAEAVGNLQKRLVEAESAVEELQTRYAAAEGDRERAQEEAGKAINELQLRLDTATKDLSEFQELRSRLDSVQKDQDAKSVELTEQLAAAVQSQKDALESRDSLQAKNDLLLADIQRLQQEFDTLLDSQGDKLAVQQDLERKIQSFQGRFEEENRLLEISREEAARLELRLQEEIKGRSQDLQTHESSLVEANEQYAQTQGTISKLQDTLAVLLKELQESQANLASSEEEKTLLQQEITTLEAENQKSKSLGRYLETQIKDSDNLISTLKADIERFQSDVARSEKACKAAEVNLSLQNAQHKRETAEFQRELSALRSRPNLEHALAELEERNNEMEELLRAKCAEIEENDDRVLEMLKEKKKLSAKVESLNRKVQNLQAKLAAAKASIIVPPLPESHSTPPPPQPSTSMPTQTPPNVSAPLSRPRSATLTITPSTIRPSTEMPSETMRKTFTRVVSGPSSVPRPKTPERMKTITPVFKARTPERRIMPEPDPMPTAIIIGKKRAAPDDFEACENIPVQAFTAEGEDVENRTPRVRRVLNSLQSGFTPIRHQINRPTAPMPSPRRSAAPMRTSPNLISDLTNSPHIPAMLTSAKPSSKRSWLGKIRGSSQDKPRSLFDREAS